MRSARFGPHLLSAFEALDGTLNKIDLSTEFGGPHDVARALWSPLLLVHAESAHCAIRERYALRVPLYQSGYAATHGRLAAALAAAQVPAAARWRTQHRRDQYHHRILANRASRAGALIARGPNGRTGCTLSRPFL